jgi:hypothetical protein
MKLGRNIQGNVDTFADLKIENILQMDIKNKFNRVYGQTFLFECEEHTGEYGSECAKALLKALRECSYTGTVLYYTGHVPVWSTNWVIGIVPEKEHAYEFWGKIRATVQTSVPSTIDFYCMEAATGVAMGQSLMFIAILNFEQGLIQKCEMGDDGDSEVCIYFERLARMIGE